MKTLIISCLAVFAFGSMAAQDGARFGVKAGVDFATFKVQEGPVEGSVSETGFFAGVFAVVPISDQFALQPEVLYVGINDGNMLSVPILVKYEVAEQFHLMAGPSLLYLLDAEEDEFKFNFDVGGSYDITEDFDVNLKYSVGFGDITVNGLFVGLGYKF